ncbi:hypothetical protein ACFLR7_04600 [Acidobacteriota bacterium]
MPINITTDLITLVSICIAIVSFSFAIYQIIRTRSANKTNEMYCRSKCKQAVDLTRTMSDEVVEACDTISRALDLELSNKYPNDNTIVKLAANIKAIRAITLNYVSFCENLNEEHAGLFKKRVIDNIDKVIPQKDCLNYPTYPPIDEDPSDVLNNKSPEE